MESQILNDWIQTYSGVKFPVHNYKSSDFRVIDIAHSLSNLCRFSGHCRTFYSVGEHSVRVARLLKKLGYDKLTQYTGLFHESSEPFIVDLSTPFKYLPEFDFYREKEDDIMKQAALSIGFIYPFPPCIKTADRVLLSTEVRDLMGNPQDWTSLTENPLKSIIKPWSPKKAKREFLKLYDKLKLYK